jgi:hypothetical protein
MMAAEWLLVQLIVKTETPVPREKPNVVAMNGLAGNREHEAVTSGKAASQPLAGHLRPCPTTTNTPTKLPDKTVTKKTDTSKRTQHVKSTTPLRDKKKPVRNANAVTNKNPPNRAKPKEEKKEKVIQLKSKVLQDLFSVGKPNRSKNWKKINKLNSNRQTFLIEELKQVGTFEPSNKLTDVLKTQENVSKYTVQRCTVVFTLIVIRNFCSLFIT